MAEESNGTPWYMNLAGSAAKGGGLALGLWAVDKLWGGKSEVEEGQEELMQQQQEFAKFILEQMKTRAGRENQYMTPMLDTLRQRTESQVNAPRNVVWSKGVFEPTLREPDQVNIPDFPTGGDLDGEGTSPFDAWLNSVIDQVSGDGEEILIDPGESPFDGINIEPDPNDMLDYNTPEVVDPVVPPVPDIDLPNDMLDYNTPELDPPEIDPSLIIPQLRPDYEPPNIDLPNDMLDYNTPEVPEIDPSLIIPQLNPDVDVPEIDPSLIIPQLNPDVDVPEIDPSLIIPQLNPDVDVPDPSLIIPQLNPDVDVPDPSLIIPQLNPDVDVPDPSLIIPQLNPDVDVPDPSLIIPQLNPDVDVPDPSLIIPQLNPDVDVPDPSLIIPQLNPDVDVPDPSLIIPQLNPDIDVPDPSLIIPQLNPDVDLDIPLETPDLTPPFRFPDKVPGVDVETPDLIPPFRFPDKVPGVELTPPFRFPDEVPDLGIDIPKIDPSLIIPQLNPDIDVPDPSLIIPQLNPDVDVPDPSLIIPQLNPDVEVPDVELSSPNIDFIQGLGTPEIEVPVPDIDPGFQLESPFDITDFKGPGLGYVDPGFKLENPFDITDFKGPGLGYVDPGFQLENVDISGFIPTPDLSEISLPSKPNIPDVNRPDFTYLDNLSFGSGFGMDFDAPGGLPNWMTDINMDITDISTDALKDALQKVAEGAKHVLGYAKDELLAELSDRIGSGAGPQYVTPEELPASELVPGDWIGETEVIRAGDEVFESMEQEIRGDEFTEEVMSEWENSFEDFNFKTPPGGVNIDILGSILSNWGPTKSLMNKLMGGQSTQRMEPVTPDTKLGTSNVTYGEMLTGWLWDGVHTRTEELRNQGLSSEEIKQTVQDDIEQGYFRPPDIETVLLRFKDNGYKWQHSDQVNWTEGKFNFVGDRGLQMTDDYDTVAAQGFRTTEEEAKLEKDIWDRRNNRERLAPTVTRRGEPDPIEEPEEAPHGHPSTTRHRGDASPHEHGTEIEDASGVGEILFPADPEPSTSDLTEDQTDYDKYFSWVSSPEGKSEFKDFRQQIFQLYGREPTKIENERWTASRMEELQAPANPPTADQIYESWNLALGEPGFNPAADANNDGIINSLDLEFASVSTEAPGIAGKVVQSVQNPIQNFNIPMMPPGIQLTSAQAAAMAQYGPLNF
jgi:hypothetical protein